MKIKAKSINVNKQELNEERLWFPKNEEYKTILEDYQNMAIRRKSQHWSFAELQAHLSMAIVNELKTIDLLKELKKDERNNLEYISSLELITRTMLNALLQIADGMAFRFLDYNYTLFTLLQANKTSPYAILQDGFQGVLDLIGKLSDFGDIKSQALITDINQVTNVGDIILKNDEYFEIIEVKKGRNKRGTRINRQNQRMETITKFINENEGIIDDKHVKLLTLPPRKHNLKILEECFKESEKNGIATKKVNEFLCVTCIDLEKIPDDRKSEIFAESYYAYKQYWDTDNIFKFHSFDFRQKSGANLPITVFPLTTSTIIDILLGTKIYSSTINIEGLKQYIDNKGWNVIDLAQMGIDHKELESLEFSIFMLEKKDDPQKTFGFHIDFLLSCMMELVDVDCYLDTAELAVNSSDEEGRWVPFYQDECGIWK